MTEEERRREVARMLASFRKHKRGGRPKSEDRCPCGVMTRARAERRKHKCEPEK
jgi:hypothetical protein